MAGHGGAWTLSGVGIRGCARGSNHCGNLVVQGPSDGTPAWMAHAPLVSAAELDGAGPSDTIGLVASTRIGQNRRRGPGERGRERLWGGGELVASPGGSQWGSGVDQWRLLESLSAAIEAADFVGTASPGPSPVGQEIGPFLQSRPIGAYRWRR